MNNGTSSALLRLRVFFLMGKTKNNVANEIKIMQMQHFCDIIIISEMYKYNAI